MPLELTKETLELAFDDLGQIARFRGLIADIAVYGGACLLLATDARQVTRDVNSVFMAEPEFLYEAADAIARKKNLPDDWLNQSVKHLVTSPGSRQPRLNVFGEYPRDDGTPGLRIFLPPPEYILAMKLIASRREDLDGARRDRHGITQLMHITSIRSGAAIMELVKGFFPTIPGIDNRVLAKIDDFIQYAKEQSQHVKRRPTWNARRGREPGGIE